MKAFLVLLIISLAGATLAQKPAPPGEVQASSPPNPNSTTLPDVIVTGTRQPEDALLSTQTVDTSRRSTDSSGLLKNMPGAAIVCNGPQTGIVQLRGLGADRVKISVDGMTITPACPNHMDPPLHYAAPETLDSIAVMAGITPVSLGGDSIGGTVIARKAEPRFAEDQSVLTFGEMGAFYRGSNDGYGFNLHSGIASRDFSASYKGAWQRANDLRFPGGRVAATGFETHQHDLLAAWRTPHGVWSLDASYLNTRDSGTPTLPMDMISDESLGLGLRYQGELDFGTLEGRLYFHSIDHVMDNFTLRPVPPGGMRMRAPSTSDDFGGSIGIALPQDIHTIRLGADFHHNAFDAFQQNAVTGMRQDILNNATRTRAGAYAELQSDWDSAWSTLLGVRNDTVLSNAASIGQFMPPSAADAAAFNARSHSFTDVNFDITTSLRFTPNHWSTYELAFARKNRAPSLLERYLWTPLSASAGQADGRTYLGNLALDSETSYQVAFTADFHGEKWQIKATPFYNIVHDYIQGVPIARLAAGLPVLQYQNVSRADLYGIDASFRYAFTEDLGLRGDVSYVRGVNRSNDDNIYRIEPLRGSLSLDSRLLGWKNSMEVVLAAAQNDVAAYNGERTTSGYALLNLRTGREFKNGLGIEIGLENVTNERYADHLGGINRVIGSDVGVGQRIPGAGRFLYLQLNYRF